MRVFREDVHMATLWILGKALPLGYASNLHPSCTFPPLIMPGLLLPPHK